MRFRWYFSLFCTTEGLSCATVQFTEQRTLSLKGRFFFFFFLRQSKLFAFLAPMSRKTALHEGSTFHINGLTIVSEAVQSHSSPFTCCFSSQPSTGLNRHIHTVNSPITRSPHIIHKLLQCSPTSTWKFTLSELAIKNLSIKTMLHSA